MLTEYIAEAMRRAAYKILEDGTYYGEVPELPGTWANGSTLELCREQLQEVVEEWIAVGLAHGSTFPQLNGARIEVTETSA